jgi:hypothetical protein
MRVPFSLCPCQHLLVVVFLMIAILTGVRWNLSVVFIWISFMARDGKCFFMFFWPTEFIPLEKRKFSCLLYWFIDFWGSLVF